CSSSDRPPFPGSWPWVTVAVSPVQSTHSRREGNPTLIAASSESPESLVAEQVFCCRICDLSREVLQPIPPPATYLDGTVTASDRGNLLRSARILARPSALVKPQLAPNIRKGPGTALGPFPSLAHSLFAESSARLYNRQPIPSTGATS